MDVGLQLPLLAALDPLLLQLVVVGSRRLAAVRLLQVRAWLGLHRPVLHLVGLVRVRLLARVGALWLSEAGLLRLGKRERAALSPVPQLPLRQLVLLLAGLLLLHPLLLVSRKSPLAELVAGVVSLEARGLLPRVALLLPAGTLLLLPLLFPARLRRAR